MVWVNGAIYGYEKKTAIDIELPRFLQIIISYYYGDIEIIRDVRESIQFQHYHF